MFVARQEPKCQESASPMSLNEIVPITAAITAFDRKEKTVVAIGKILDCRPAPDELIVHVDGGRQELAQVLRQSFPNITIIVSGDSIGPGGGRNKLMSQARNEYIVNFDDDSYPLDVDFFSRVLELFTKFPEASVIGATIFHQNEAILPPQREIRTASGFVGCGVAFQRGDLLQAGGYVPLPIAYGAEEEDISLRLYDQKKIIYSSSWLRVFHDTSLSHHSDPKINAHAIANLGLLAFLRYPKRYCLLGVAQVGSRVLWCLRKGRWRGIGRGLALIFVEIWRFRAQRAPVSAAGIEAKRNARRAQISRF